MTARPTVSLLVMDLDNTVWDWFDMWYRSFDALLRSLCELTGVPRSTLEDEARAVHRLRGTTEYSFLLREMPSIARAAEGKEPMTVFDDALHAQNRARNESIALYPGVAETLKRLQSQGTRLVAYTESLAYWTGWRMRKTGLDAVLDVLYTSPDHDFPAGLSPERVRWYPASEYELERTEHREVERGIQKPQPEVLRQVLHDEGVAPERALYVGDSLMKDVAMAQAIDGLWDAHAAYGVASARHEYELLRRVSHWKPADIVREQSLESGAVVPTIELREHFSEVLDHFNFAGRRV